MPRSVKELFAAALDIPDPAERAAFLDRECPPDPDLRRRLDALLHAHDDPASVVNRPLVAPPAPGRAAAPTPGSPHAAATGGPPETAHHTPRPDAGMVLGGRYKLVEEIGEGGMGTVWMAQQTESVKRAVAVKLVKPGMDSKAVLARFEAERQALAVMDHPSIARVLDAGAAPDGRPYFVMELVRGVPITRFCDARKLTPRQRLELFVPVCLAIQHAHQKGVIHRDVKPGNVLVALYDDKPVPKVIDFGVAKATGPALTDKTLMTGFGAVVGTPEYMSPEQASLNNLDVDTRSDVYALGVLLYELLAGSPPFRGDELRRAGLLEMLRVVREQEPPRPSARLSTAHTAGTISADRGTEPKKLAGLLRGELDWVVMKALEKDRARRYESAAGFAADVQRYLAGEAVQAHPARAAYRLRKFAHKRRALLATAAAFVGLLAGAAAVSGWLAVQATRAEGRAAARRAEAEASAREALQNAALYKEASAENRAARVESDVKALGLQIDLDLAELEPDHRVGLLRLARPRTQENVSQIEVLDKGNNALDGTLGLDSHGRGKALREFVTTAVLSHGQHYAPLRTPITHDGHAVVRSQAGPDGRALLTLGADGTARLWDLRTGRAVATLLRDRPRVDAWGFSPDGRTAFAQDASGSTHLWDAATGAPRARVEPVARPAAARDAHVRISDTRLLTVTALRGDGDADVDRAAGPRRADAKLWDTATGRLVARPAGFDGDPDWFDFLGDGRWVVTRDGPAAVRVFSAEDGRPLARLAAPEGEAVIGVAASPTARRVGVLLSAGAGDAVLRTWDATTWRPDRDAARFRTGLSVARHPLFLLTEELAAFPDDAEFPAPRGWHLHRAGRAEPQGWAATAGPRAGDLLHLGNGRVLSLAAWAPVRPPAGRKYPAELARFAPDGRFVAVRQDAESPERLLDTRADKAMPDASGAWSYLPPADGRPGCWVDVARPRHVVETRLLPPAGRLAVPPDALELWAQVAARGELGPDGEFVKWDEPTWERRRQQLAAVPAPDPTFPFPGRVATDRLHWLRREFGEATAGADRLRLVQELLRRSEADGDRAEAVRWHAELGTLAPEVAPPPRRAKP